MNIERRTISIASACAALFCLLTVGATMVAAESSADAYRILWRFKTGRQILGAAAIGKDGAVYVGSVDGFVYALNSDGSEKWRFDAQAPIETNITVDDDGRLYVPARSLLAVSAKGKLLWKYVSKLGNSSAVALGPAKTIYVSIDDDLCALTGTGELKWSRPVLAKSPETGPIVGCDDNIYVDGQKAGSGISRMNSFAPNGDLRSRFEITGIFGNSPAMDHDGNSYIVLAVGDSPGLYALNKQGQLSWKFNAENLRDTPVIGFDRTIYIGSVDGLLYAINPDGSLKWKFQAPNGITRSPVVDGDGVITVASGNKICSVRPTGELKSEFEIGPEWRCGAAPVIGTDGTMYVGGVDGYLYALGGFKPPPRSEWPMKRHDQRGAARIDPISKDAQSAQH